MPVATEKKPKRNAQSNGIQVIARAARILRALGESTGSSLADISESVGLPRSTVHRMVLALEAERLVSCNGPAQYRLGPEILHLAEYCKSGLIRDIHPYLGRLSRELDETVDLSVRSGHMVTVVDQIIAMHRLKVDAALGKSFPLYCTAGGKAILAALPDDIGQAVLDGPLEAFTPKTITNRAELQKQIAQVRKTGISFDREELAAGLCAVGSCLTISGSEIIGISIPVPAGRFYGQEDHLSRALSRFVSEIASAFPGVDRVFPRDLKNEHGISKRPTA
jgi:DNA-binding IclR family transcriptional regulator